MDSFEVGVALALPGGVAAGLLAIGRAMAAVDAAVEAGGRGLVALLAGAAVASAGVGPDAADAEEVAGGPVVARDGHGGMAPTLGGDALEVAGPVRGRVRAELDAAAPFAGTPAEVTAEVRAIVAERVAELSGGEQARAFARGVVEARMNAAAPAIDALPALRTETGEAEAMELDMQGGTVRRTGATLVRDAATPVRGRVSAAAWRDGLDLVATGGEQPVSAVMGPPTPASAPASASASDYGSMVDMPAGASPAMRANVTAIRPGWDAGARESSAGPRSDVLGDSNAPVPFGVPSAERGAAGAALFPERASAPREERDGREGGGGTVMLDGRLVGQWLVERMARDAGRPGAGMTGFDVRQGPAWVPSGVG